MKQRTVTTIKTVEELFDIIKSGDLGEAYLVLEEDNCIYFSGKDNQNFELSQELSYTKCCEIVQQLLKLSGIKIHWT